MTFEAYLTLRNAADYAEFLMPHLAPDSQVMDVGCGGGSISIGLAKLVRNVIGVDLEEANFADARQYAAQHGIENLEFRTGSMYALDFPADQFDACLCHSMLETLDRPLDGLQEIKRTLKPGGVLGAACVEYGGLILAGPQSVATTGTPALQNGMDWPPAATSMPWNTPGWNGRNHPWRMPRLRGVGRLDGNQ